MWLFLNSSCLLSVSPWLLDPGFLTCRTNALLLSYIPIASYFVIPIWSFKKFFYSFLKDFLKYRYLCEYGVCYEHVQVGGHWIPRNWSSTWCGCWKPNLGPQEERSTLLITKPPSPARYYYCCCAWLGWGGSFVHVHTDEARWGCPIPRSWNVVSHLTWALELNFGPLHEQCWINPWAISSAL